MYCKGWKYEDYVLDYHLKELELAHDMNNPNIEANALGNLGNTLRSLCRFEEASQMCRQQLQIWRELGNRFGLKIYKRR